MLGITVGQHSGEVMMLRLVDAPDLACVGRRCEHDREREAEILGPGARHAPEQSRRDGGAGAGKAAEGNAQSLNGADRRVLRGRQSGGRRGLPPAIFHETRHENEHAGCRQGGGYQVQAVEELLHPGMRLVAHQHFLDELDDAAADDAGEDRGDDQRGDENCLSSAPELKKARRHRCQK